jgi:hypothetical protein
MAMRRVTGDEARPRKAGLVLHFVRSPHYSHFPRVHGSAQVPMPEALPVVAVPRRGCLFEV